MQLLSGQLLIICKPHLLIIRGTNPPSCPYPLKIVQKKVETILSLSQGTVCDAKRSWALFHAPLCTFKAAVDLFDKQQDAKESLNFVLEPFAKVKSPFLNQLQNLPLLFST